MPPAVLQRRLVPALHVLVPGRYELVHADQCRHHFLRIKAMFAVELRSNSRADRKSKPEEF